MFKTGDNVRLINPDKGYQAGVLIDFCFPYWTVQLSSGLEIQCYEDEFEEV